MSDSLLALLDELRIIAQNGLRYAENPYDEERYDRILELVGTQYGEVSGLRGSEVTARFRDRLGHVTPNIGGRAGIVDSAGRILLMKRAGEGEWCLPGGFVDPGETPRETTIREAREETGLDVELLELVSFQYREPDEHNPHGFVGVLYLCSVTGGTLAGSHEDEGLAYMHPDSVPTWHKEHEEAARLVLERCRDRTEGEY